MPPQAQQAALLLKLELCLHLPLPEPGSPVSPQLFLRVSLTSLCGSLAHSRFGEKDLLESAVGLVASGEGCCSDSPGLKALLDFCSCLSGHGPEAQGLTHQTKNKFRVSFKLVFLLRCLLACDSWSGAIATHSLSLEMFI